MALRDPRPDLFDDAIDLLREADRMHRQFFRLALGRAGSCWEPPVDIVEHDQHVLIRIALPGVRPDNVQVQTDGTSLHVVGVRNLDAAFGDTIHRLEIPHGRFERRIDLPPGRFEVRQRTHADGCLVLALWRLA